MTIVGNSVQAEAKTAVPLGPESWQPGGEPDPLSRREPGLIGAPVSRLDGALKVTGAAPFAADVHLDGMVYASLAFSTIAKGRLAAIDTSAAEGAAGVVLVMTYRNAPRMKPTPLFMSSGRAAGGDDLPVMQDDRIHWNGQPIAVVLAGTQEEADHARSLIRATYEEEESATSFAEARAHARPSSFGGAPLTDERGDVEAALAAASFSVDLDYRTPYHSHNAIEPHAATVAWDGDELIVHDATQGVTHMAWSLADIFGLEEEQVHVTSPFVGGAFGGKTMWQHHVLGAAASKLVGRPVRIALSREGVYRLVGGRSLTEQRVAIGADADGRFQALIQTGTVAKTRHNALPEPFILPARCLYASDNLRLDVQAVELDMLANTFLRAPGQAVGSFALECAIDELSERIGIDPVELRIRNEPDTDPISGKAFSSRHLVEAFRTGAERFGWANRDRRPGARREGEWLTGMGCATATYPYHRFSGGVARITHDQGRTRRGRDRSARHGYGHRHCPGAGHRRTAGRAPRVGIRRLWRLAVPGRRPRRRIASDRLDRGSGDRCATRARGRAPEACRRRLAAGGSRAG